LVVQEVAAEVAEGVGAAGGGRAGRLAVGVGGLGQAEGGGEQFAGFGAEVGVEAPPSAQGARQVQTLGRFRLGVSVGAGTFPPGPHGGSDIADRQVHQGRQHHGLVVGEQAERVGVEVGGDGLHLAPRQHTVAPRPGDLGQLGEFAGPRRQRRRPGAGQAGPVGEPGGHGGGAVEFPPPGAVMGGDGVADTGVEPVA
jgi:hypothetical protein